MKKAKTVALLLALDWGYCRSVVNGVTSYVRLHEQWTVRVMSATAIQSAPRFLGRDVHGVIGSFGIPEEEQFFRDRGIPAVNISMRSQ